MILSSVWWFAQRGGDGYFGRRPAGSTLF